MDDTTSRYGVAIAASATVSSSCYHAYPPPPPGYPHIPPSSRHDSIGSPTSVWKMKDRSSAGVDPQRKKYLFITRRFGWVSDPSRNCYVSPPRPFPLPSSLPPCALVRVPMAAAPGILSLFIPTVWPREDKSDSPWPPHHILHVSPAWMRGYFHKSSHPPPHTPLSATYSLILATE